MSTSKRIFLFLLLGFLCLVFTAVIALAAVVAVHVSELSAAEKHEYKTFASCGDLATWLNKAKDNNSYYPLFDDVVRLDSAAVPSADGVAEGSKDYSTTNVQVEGVDEADIIKTDGDYLYVVSGKKVIIVQADDGEFTKLSEISLSGAAQEMYLDGNKLVIYSTDYRNFAAGEGGATSSSDGVAAPDSIVFPGGGDQSIVSVYVYDITDREQPAFERKVSVEGTYLTSRMIDGVTYVVSNFYSNLYDAQITESNAINFLPQIADSVEAGVDNYETIIDCDQIAYLGDVSSQFLTVVAVPVSGNALGTNMLLTGAENVYASLENLYVVKTFYSQDVYRALSCDLIDRVFVPGRCIPPTTTNNTETTSIYKFALNGAEVVYTKSAQVEGRVLNQFSMDEYDGTFRIAVTKGQVWNERAPSQSNLHIFDDNMSEVAALEGLGKGEQIHSVRFLGDRAYVVTFQKTDPFYVLDLGDASNPKILGELKIPGYSDYLHPYDSNHIIGIGKQAEEADSGNFAWYQGLKMALFDVTDPTNPIVQYEVEVGDRGSESEVLSNHKAFLFDKDKELMVLPVSLATVANKTDETPDNAYGDPSFTGFLVYNVSLDGGIEELGKIAVKPDDKYDYWWFGSTFGSRSLYIDDVLVTYSNDQLQSHRLKSLKSIDSLEWK